MQAKWLEPLHADFARCDTVVVGIHARMGSLQMARKAKQRLGLLKEDADPTSVDALFSDELHTLRCARWWPVLALA